MKFYCEILCDNETAPVAFTIEAASAHDAVRILAAYTKGLFEGSGKGADIQSVSTKKSRGVEYRGL